jgi:hypothetical protein
MLYKENCFCAWVNEEEVDKSSLFWNITPYSPLKANRRFGGTLHDVISQKIELFITTAVRA